MRLLSRQGVDTHAKFITEALEAATFYEKPLCITLDELEQLETAMQASLLMVGFNRRFSPQVKKIKDLLSGVSQPKAMIITVNAGHLPSAEWQHDPKIGGGRIIGEMCHFVDLMRFLVGHPITDFGKITSKFSTQDTVAANLVFSDGSIGTINYFANGSKSFPKERLEVFCGGRIL